MSNGFLQTITKATRIHGDSFSLIDHILTNSLTSIKSCGTLLSDISDHFINFIMLPLVIPKKKPKNIKKRIFSKNNIERFKIALDQLSWQNVTHANEVDMAFDIFWNDFKTLFDLHFPEHVVKFNKNIHPKLPFLTQGLLVSRKTKLKLHKLTLTCPTEENKVNYKNYRNRYLSLIKLSKKLHYENSLRNSKKNPKKTWEIIKEVTYGQLNSKKIEKITTNGTTLSSPQDIANEFNNFFSEIGKTISENILPTTKKPEDYLTNVPDPPLLDLGQTGPIHICDILKTLEPKKSTDMDGLSMSLIKQISTQIAVPLAHVFNLSLTSGIFPSKLKTSRTVPIHKAGRHDLCDNYRPISLLSTLSKILEKMVSLQLVNHLDINNLLYKHQYGFQKNKSTEHHLLQLSNFVSNALNENKYCIGIFLDLKKAFDVCSHQILLKKLKKLGIKNTALGWFSSYLDNRKQIVDVDGHKSSEKDIKISVLQGSILGPILFLCYINDMPMSTVLFTLLFADDTACLASGKNLQELITLVNAELNKIAVWFRVNRMAVNIGKTKFIIFHSKNKVIDMGENSVVFDNNEPDTIFRPDLVTPLERVHNNHINPESRTYKLLGVLLDENFTFNTHLYKLCNKLSRSLYFIRRAQNILSRDALVSLYYATIHSHLLYCPILLSGSTMNNINRVKILQKKAIRVVTGSKSREHTNPLFKNLGILPYDKIVKQAKLKLMHAVYYKYAPKTFANIWQTNVDRDLDYNLRNMNDFTLPAPKTEFFKRQPLYTLPLEWNNLDEIKLQHNCTTFQICLKNNLLNEIP